MKLTIKHVNTCLPDYWSGHHQAYVQIPVWNGMTIRQVRLALRDEIRQGAVSGNDEIAHLLSWDLVPEGKEKEADQLTKAVYAAINRVKQNGRGRKNLFPDLEKETDDYCGSVYAYFLIEEE